jgi:predicted nucleic acid-binding protein
MSDCPFLDTNVLLRFLLGDDERQSSAAGRLIDQVASGERCVLTSSTAVFEAMYTLTKTYQLDRDEVALRLQSILELDAIHMPDKPIIFQAFRLFAQYRQLSLADCYHASLSLAQSAGQVYTFDRDFRRIPGITRLEPGE